MSTTDDLWTTTAVAASEARASDSVAQAIAFRADIMRMTQAAEDAVLTPVEPGRWPHALRAALACRIARLNACSALASHYAGMIGTEQYAAIADPANSNVEHELEPAVAFMDRVATRPRDVTASDIEILQSAGVSDADIVRLAELNAFLGYQIRLVAGITLLREVAP